MIVYVCCRVSISGEILDQVVCIPCTSILILKLKRKGQLGSKGVTESYLFYLILPGYRSGVGERYFLG